MEFFEWAIAAGMFLIGLTAAITIYLGRRNPETAPYLPSIAGAFHVGRVRTHSDPSHERDTGDSDKKDKPPGKL